MVLAYALLGEPDHRDESLATLRAVKEIWEPDSYRAELLSVVWQWVRTRNLPLEAGAAVLRDAEALVTQVVPSSALWEQALELAAVREHPTYDALFVALAAARDCKVVTYDRAMLAAFPEYTIEPAAYLKGTRRRRKK